MRIALFSVPVELPDPRMTLAAKAGEEVFASSVRSEGQLPIMPKIAVISLIKWMEQHGYKDQWDFYDVDMLLPSDAEIIAYLREYNPDVVGLSAVVSTCYAQVKRLARLIRQTCPRAGIVLGGSLAASASLVLRKTKVNVCIEGDGEVPWVELLDSLSIASPLGFKSIPGLAFLDINDDLVFTGYGKGITGHAHPFPDYDILLKGLKHRPELLANYFRPGLGATFFQTDPRSYEPTRRPMLAQLWSSKGCVARCTFCQRSTKGYRTFDPAELDAHLKMLASRFNVGFIHILDENFGSDNAYARKLADVMHANDMLWIASGVRVSSVSYDDLAYFKARGCCSLKFGVESGSQLIMDVMEKKFTTAQVFETLANCHKLGIYSPLAVMVGMPGETIETATQTGRFVGKLSYLCGVSPKYAGVSVFYALPLPGTPLYVYGQRIGVIGKDPDAEEAFLLSVSGTGANKVNYVNLNGAPIKEVLWWDWLVHLEAMREYQWYVKECGEPRRGFVQSVIIADKEREIAGKALTLRQVMQALSGHSLKGLKGKAFYALDNWLEKAVHYEWITRLPRGVVYTVLRALVYLNYRMQGLALSMIGRTLNLWNTWPHVERLTVPPSQEQKVTINTSLRRIVKAGQSKDDAGPTAQDVLSIGL